VFRAPLGQGIASFAPSPDGRLLSVVTRLDRFRRAVLVMPAEGGTPRQVHEFREPSGGGGAQVWGRTGGRSSMSRVPFVERGPQVSPLERSSRRGTGGTEDDLQLDRPVLRASFPPEWSVLAFTGRPNVSSSSEVWVIENLKEELKLVAAPHQKHP